MIQVIAMMTTPAAQAVNRFIKPSRILAALPSRLLSALSLNQSLEKLLAHSFHHRSLPSFKGARKQQRNRHNHYIMTIILVFINNINNSNKLLTAMMMMMTTWAPCQQVPRR